MVAALARLAERAAEHADAGDGRAQPQRRRPGHHPRQALRQRRRGAARQALERLDELLERYPLRGIKGPVGTQQDQLDLLGGDEAVAELEARSPPPRLRGHVLTNVGQVYPARSTSTSSPPSCRWRPPRRAWPPPSG
jgi:adenylosuccinate lyase